MSEKMQISFETAEELALLEAIKIRAKLEGISIKDLVLRALEFRISQALNGKPFESNRDSVTKQDLSRLAQECNRKLSQLDLKVMSEIRKDREQIALLAHAVAEATEAIVSLQSQLDSEA